MTHPSPTPGASTDVLHTRKCFYVGGRYVDYPPKTTGQVVVEQLYVEELCPAQINHPHPIVFWPGMGQTGIGWITTPDGRPGWAHSFLRRGYKVYVIDSPERGRSAWLPGSSNLTNVTHDYAERFWTNTAQSKHLWPQADLLTQWPGKGVRGDPTFDTFMASQMQSRADYPEAERLARELGAKLLRQIGPAVLCCHSQGGAHGFAIADEAPEAVVAYVALEPLGPPFYNRVTSLVSTPDPLYRARPYGLTTTPLRYEPAVERAKDLEVEEMVPTREDICGLILQKEPARELVNLARVRTLVVTSEVGYHAHYDHATVAYLQQAGVRVDWMHLPQAGIRGNGHFMFIEKNSEEIADKVHVWIRENAQ